MPHEENKRQSTNIPLSVHTLESYNKPLESPLLSTSLLQSLSSKARKLTGLGYHKYKLVTNQPTSNRPMDGGEKDYQREKTC